MVDKMTEEGIHFVVSIVVPVYNVAQYLPQCLDSILGQSYGDLEVLCVNDGSTDSSLRILEEYAARDSRILVFTKENEGKGAASARNLGLDHASGTYVFFLDSDDFFDSDMVESMVGKAEATEADVVVCRADFFDDRRQEIAGSYRTIELWRVPEKEPFSFRDCPEHIFQIGDVIAWNKLFRRDLLERHRLRFEAIPISDEQYVSSLAMVFAERIAVVDRPFVKYRFHTGTSQADGRARHPEAAYLATYSIVDRMREAGIYGEVKRSYLNMAMRLMREYFDKMPEYRTMKFLYDTYWSEVFPRLGAESLPDDYFYDSRIGDWYRLIRDCPLEEILFRAVRAYGNGMTTAILRFQVPYERIPYGSRIALVGKGIVGRYWHAQLLLSEHCEVACWVAGEADIPEGLEYDAVLCAR